jgi:hypothetical protein
MKVITFSRQFPATHPRKGEPTHFVEKIWDSLIDIGEISLSKCVELSRYTGICEGYISINSLKRTIPKPKNHTIRAGNRWKVGEYFSPRVWSGKPYASKQIEFAPPIQIKKIWTFEMKPALWFDECQYFINGVFYNEHLENVSKNDGLGLIDFALWFAGSGAASSTRKPFKGQILCWNESINYLTPEEVNTRLIQS